MKLALKVKQQPKNKKNSCKKQQSMWLSNHMLFLF